MTQYKWSFNRNKHATAGY